ncbi:hypothetical protein D1871_14805 [Nakamurella silvestris]|nr:hypothetical protein D1871_14805 [Nakamurella silvestris]
MIRFLVSTLIFLASSALGLLVAKWVLDDMHINLGSFVIVVLIFTAVQALMTPFLFKVVRQNAPALLGAVGLLSTYIALLVSSLLSSGLTINGFSTWVFACLIVWIVTMLATLLLPLFVAKKYIRGRRNNNNDVAA